MINFFSLIRGFYYDYRKKNSLALSHYKKSKSTFPFVIYRMGTLFLQQKQWKQAEKFLEQALNGLNKKSFCAYRLGVALERQGRKQEAASFFYQALKLRPGWLPWVEHYLTCRLAVGEDSINEDDMLLLGAKEADAWHGIAALRIKNGKPYQAIPAMERALQLSPKKGIWWYELATCLEKLGRTEAAEKAYLKAKDGGIKNEKLFYHLGMIQENLGKIKEAIANYEVACKLGKKDHKYGAGLLHKADGNWPKTVEAFSRYVHKFPGVDALACYNLGMALDFCCEWEKACEQMELAIALDGKKKPDWYGRLGVLYERCGQRKNACEAYRQAINAGGSREFYFRLGSCLEKMGEYQEACKAYIQSQDYAVIPFSSIKNLKKKLARADFNPYLAWKLGVTLTEVGCYQDACVAFAQTRRILPVSPYGLSDKKIKENPSFCRNTIYLNFCKTLPIDEHCILYESFLSNTMSCSPYAIFKYIYNSSEYAGFLHVWVINDISCVPPQFREAENIVFISRESDSYLRYIATAKYLINNVTFPSYFIRREGQIYCNTWHGTPLKSLGDANKFGQFAYGNVSRNFLQASWLIQPNKYTEDIMLDRYHVRSIISGQSVISGYPRQDLMLNISAEDQEKLKQQLVGDDNRPILLYAPTWRDYQTLEVQEQRTRDTLAVLSESGYHVIFKGHQFLEKKFRKLGFPIPPVWLDTNELLSVVDIVITDYSSIGIDFLATGRPTIYYVDDVEEYMDGRGLCVPIEEFPGIVCRSLGELMRTLNNPLSVLELEDWQKELFVYDDGHATERVIDFIFNKKPKPVETNRPAVLFYGGTLLHNGIGTAFISLIESIADAIDIYITIDTSNLLDDTRLSLIKHLLSKVHILPRCGDMLVTLEEDWYIQKWNKYNTFCNNNFKDIVMNSYKRECYRLFGKSHFKAAVNYEGYNAFYTSILAASGEHVDRKIIYLHANMAAELSARHSYLIKIFGLYNFYDSVVSVSKATSEINRDSLAITWGIESIKFSYVDNLLNIQSVINKSIQDLSEQEMVFFNGKTIFITIGRLSVEKDHAKLIKAFAEVVNQYPESKLLILGDGYLRLELMALINELRLSDNIFLMGHINNPYPWLAKADCFVLSSNHEGQPMVLLEAMALNRPIIATDIPATRGMLMNSSAKLVENSINGLATGLLEACREMPKPVEIDFNKYNKNCVEQFYHISNIPY